MSERAKSSIPSPELARKNRRLLLILLASFVVPFLIGDLAYRMEWYKGAQVNKGQLMDPPASFADFQARDERGTRLDSGFAKKSWWLLYVVPPQCEAACRNRLFQMRQVRRALGKEAERVKQVLVMSASSTPAVEALLQEEFSGFMRVHAEAENLDSALKGVTAQASRAGQLYIMDPMGWIMLAYAAEPDEKASVVKAEEILQDLRKLLKASRIG